MAKFSVIIPTHKRPDSLSQLLQSIAQQVLAYNDQLEVIVVSNLWDSKSQDIVESYQKSLPVKFFVSGTLGVNRARNVGLRHASGEIIILLDDDCFLADENYFQKVFQWHKRNPHVDVIGGRYDVGREASLLEKAYHLNSDFWLSKAKIGPLQTTRVIGGNFTAKAHVFADIHKFNENIQFGGSESELSARLVKSGLCLYTSDELRVTHNNPLNFWQFITRAFKQGRGRKFEEDVGLDIPSYTGVESTEDIFSGMNGIILALYLSLYGFFFRCGYRHGRLYTNKPVGFVSFCKVVIQEILEAPLSQSTLHKVSLYHPYHLMKYPKFKLAAIYHWLSARRWKIPDLFKRSTSFVRWRIFNPLYWQSYRWVKSFKSQTWRIPYALAWPLRKTYWGIYHLITTMIGVTKSVFAKAIGSIRRISGWVHQGLLRSYWLVHRTILGKLWKLSPFIWLQRTFGVTQKVFVRGYWLFHRHVLSHVWRLKVVYTKPLGLAFRVYGFFRMLLVRGYWALHEKVLSRVWRLKILVTAPVEATFRIFGYLKMMSSRAYWILHETFIAKLWRFKVIYSIPWGWGLRLLGLIKMIVIDTYWLFHRFVLSKAWRLKIIYTFPRDLVLRAVGVTKMIIIRSYWVFHRSTISQAWRLKPLFVIPWGLINRFYGCFKMILIRTYWLTHRWTISQFWRLKLTLFRPIMKVYWFSEYQVKKIRKGRQESSKSTA